MIMGIPIARRNLLHEKGKLLLSVTGVAASLTLILLLLGFREGLYTTLTAFADNLGADIIVAQSGVQGMFSAQSAVSLNLHDEALTATNATEAGHIIVADIIFTKNETKTPVLLVGFDPNTTFGAPWHMGEGRGIEADDEILLDTWLAERAGIFLNDTVEILGQSFTVVGLTRETASWMSPYIFVSLDAATLTLGLNNMVSYHLLRLPPEANLAQAMNAIETQLPSVDALTPAEISKADRRVLATIMDTPINVMLVIGFIIGVAVMGLTAYTAVVNHLREYGVLKAIGANRRNLMWLVAQETLYRAIFGYLLGIALAFSIAALIMAKWSQFTIVIGWQSVLIVGGLTLIMTLLSALLPLRGLNKLDPMLVFKS
jgi:putative ABC transport system permease protein